MGTYVLFLNSKTVTWFSPIHNEKLAMFLLTITYGCHHGSRNSKNSAAYKRGTIGIIVLKTSVPGYNCKARSHNV